MPGFDDALAAALKGEEVHPEVAPETPAVEAQPAETGVETPAAEQETPAQAAQRARDEAGRFAKKEETPEAQPKQPAAAAKPAQGQPAATPKAPEATPAASAAPRSWAPAVREHWNALPRPVKDEILKREGAASRAIGEAEQAKRFHQEFEAVAAPYKALFTAPPVQVAANLFQTAAVLHTGTPSEKMEVMASVARNFNIPPAELAASIIRGFGVSPDAVADILEGKRPAQPAQPQGQPYRDPRVDELLRRQHEAEQRAQQGTLSVAQQALQEFEASAPEFLEDVRGDMVLLLETGKAKDYPEAYRKACAMSDEVGRVLEERKATAARTQSQQAQKARHAAGSVKSDPAPPAGSRKPSFDDALAAAISGR
jgi:hypothetical protein